MQTGPHLQTSKTSNFCRKEIVNTTAKHHRNARNFIIKDSSFASLRIYGEVECKEYGIYNKFHHQFSPSWSLIIHSPRYAVSQNHLFTCSPSSFVQLTCVTFVPTYIHRLYIPSLILRHPCSKQAKVCLVFNINFLGT